MKALDQVSRGFLAALPLSIENDSYSQRRCKSSQEERAVNEESPPPQLGNRRNTFHGTECRRDSLICWREEISPEMGNRTTLSKQFPTSKARATVLDEESNEIATDEGNQKEIESSLI